MLAPFNAPRTFKRELSPAIYPDDSDIPDLTAATLARVSLAHLCAEYVS